MQAKKINVEKRLQGQLNEPERFLARLTFHLVPQIICLRKLIPKASYVKKRYAFDDSSFFTLNKNSLAGQRLFQKLNASMHAIVNKFLKELIIVASNNRNNIDDAFEVYTFSFEYEPDTHITVNSPTGRNEIRYNGEKVMREQIASAISEIIDLGNNLSAVPPDSFCSLRATFYDKSLPSGYGLEGWYDTDNLYAMQKDATKLKLGEINAQAGTMFLNVESTLVISDTQDTSSSMKKEVSKEHGSKLPNSAIEQNYSELTNAVGAMSLANVKNNLDGETFLNSSQCSNKKERSNKRRKPANSGRRGKILRSLRLDVPALDVTACSDLEHT